MQQCGFVALVGRPNAGKSTLMNALLGQKIVGVSAKPQTTRHRILGVGMEGEAQILFLDTPGLHRNPEGKALNSRLNREAARTFGEAHVICYLVAMGHPPGSEDRSFLAQALRSECPVWLFLSQTDRVKKSEWQTALAELEAFAKGIVAEDSETKPPQKIAAISAKSPEDVEALRSSLAEQMPQGEWLYPEDDLTDRSGTFVCEELIREQLFRHLGQEIPYNSTVKLESVDADSPVVHLEGVIVVARDSQKGMVVGKRGSKIRAISSDARESLERHFGRQVFLKLQVVVDKDWMHNQHALNEYLGDIES